MTPLKKILFIFVFLFLLFSVGLALYFRIEHIHLSQIQKVTVEERKVGFEKVLKLNQQAIFVLAKDYSYWDELVDAIKNEDLQWSWVNIDSGIKTYNADAAWTYNVDFKKIYSVNRFGDERLKNLPFNIEQVQKIFSGQSLVHFYVETPAGYLEVQGATVHPSNDSERKTPPQGYFFVGKLWDKEYLESLSQLIDCKISVISANDIGDIKIKDHVFVVSMRGWDNAPLFNILGSVDSRVLENFHRESRSFLKMFMIYTSLQMLVLLYFLRRFLKRTV